MDSLYRVKLTLLGSREDKVNCKQLDPNELPPYSMLALSDSDLPSSHSKFMLWFGGCSEDE